jgi:hypothetical protein
MPATIVHLPLFLFWFLRYVQFAKDRFKVKTKGTEVSKGVNNYENQWDIGIHINSDHTSKLINHDSLFRRKRSMYFLSTLNVVPTRILTAHILP